MDREAALARQYDMLIGQMGVERARHPLRFERSDDGSAHVECLPDDGWVRRVTERGRVVQEARYDSDDALLYRLVCDVASVEGSRWQSEQPFDGRDPRRADFARRLELVGRVSPAWRIRLAEELAQWLSRHPYVDRPIPPVVSGSTRRGLLGLLVVALLTTGWALAHLPLFQIWAHQARLARTGIPVSADVVDRSMTDGKFANQYFVTYRYKGPSRDHVGRDTIDWLTYRRLEPRGSTVEVVFDPSDPATSMVRGNDRGGRLAWIYAAIDGILALLIARGLWKARRAAAPG